MKGTISIRPISKVVALESLDYVGHPRQGLLTSIIRFVVKFSSIKLLLHKNVPYFPYYIWGLNNHKHGVLTKRIAE